MSSAWMISNDSVPFARSSGAPYVGRFDGEMSETFDPTEVYRELAPAVLGYLRAQAAEDPEDLLGEIFLQVVRDRHRFQGSSDDLRRWVFSIAHNRLIDHFRRRRRRPPPAPLTDQHDVVDHRAIDASLPDGELLEALASLTPEQRQVVVLRFVGDLSIEDVARIVRRRPGAVKALQQRGLTQLVRRLGG
jgi:RNA polymerase sigma-70 factor (ECF subfamily)